MKLLFSRAGIVPAFACITVICISTIGCGMAASPQPPSLHLPRPVHDLTAARAGNRVALNWNTPRETTDRLRIHNLVQLRICRQQQGESCESVATISVPPGKPYEYSDPLPPNLTTGPRRPITYQVLGLNKHGRSAGPSNPASTLAGEAPQPIQNFSGAMTERGVILRWKPLPGLSPGSSIQLQRRLLTPPAPGRNSRTPGGLASAPEPLEQTLQVSTQPTGADPGASLDTSVEFNREYQYVAIRVLDARAGKQQIEMASDPSPSIVVSTRDTFPPAPPAGLAAVPVPASLNGGTPEIDLSWSSNTEPDLAQYIVYRRDVASPAPASQIAPENTSASIVAPTFRDTHVQPGHTYAYTLVAVDNAGNKSPRSPEIRVTVPGAS